MRLHGNFFDKSLAAILVKTTEGQSFGGGSDGEGVGTVSIFARMAHRGLL